MGSCGYVLTEQDVKGREAVRENEALQMDMGSRSLVAVKSTRCREWDMPGVVSCKRSTETTASL